MRAILKVFTFAIHYTCRSLGDYAAYQTNCAPALQKQHIQKFGGEFITSRTLMEVLD
jgi:hypothetical protein